MAGHHVSVLYVHDDLLPDTANDILFSIDSFVESLGKFGIRVDACQARDLRLRDLSPYNALLYDTSTLQCTPPNVVVYQKKLLRVLDEYSARDLAGIILGEKPAAEAWRENNLQYVELFGANLYSANGANYVSDGNGGVIPAGLTRGPRNYN